MDARHVSLSLRILVLPNNSHPLHTLVLILVDENPRVRLETQDVFLHGLPVKRATFVRCGYHRL